MHLSIALKAPTHECIAVQVVGGAEEIRGVILLGRTDNFPVFHFQPSMVVNLGQITVFTKESVRQFSTRRNKTRYQIGLGIL